MNTTLQLQQKSMLRETAGIVSLHCKVKSLQWYRILNSLIRFLYRALYIWTKCLFWVVYLVLSLDFVLHSGEVFSSSCLHICGPEESVADYRQLQTVAFMHLALRELQEGGPWQGRLVPWFSFCHRGWVLVRPPTQDQFALGRPSRPRGSVIFRRA